MKGDHTFEKFRRIRHSSEYERIRLEGRRYHTAHFIVTVNPGQDVSRLGITISRKVGNAVCRNQLKRWIRNWFRNSYKQFNRTVDISIIARRHAGRLNHPQVVQELLAVFARLETEHHV